MSSSRTLFFATKSSAVGVVPSHEVAELANFLAYKTSPDLVEGAISRLHEDGGCLQVHWTGSVPALLGNKALDPIFHIIETCWPGKVENWLNGEILT